MLQHFDTLIAFALVMLLLSLLVTVLVQLVNVALQRRGRNMRWGMVLLLKQMELGDAEAGRLADAVLKHPTVSADGVTFAEAATPQSLRLLLERVRDKGDEVVRPGGLDFLFKRIWTWLIDLWGRLRKERDEVALPGKASAQSLQAAADKVLAKLGLEGIEPAEESVESELPAELAALVKSALGKAQDETEELISQASTQLQQRVREALERASREAVALRNRGRQWFDMVMSQTTERFVSQTKRVTMIASLALCLVFQIDAVDLINQFSSNAELRGALVASANEQLAEHGETLAMTERLTGLAGVAMRTALEPVDADSDVRAGLRQELAERVTSTLRNEREWQEWIESELAGPSAPQLGTAQQRAAFAQQLRGEFEQRFDEQLAGAEEQLEGAAVELVNQLEQMQLSLFERRPLRELGWQSWLGMIVMALLLSLGAPFWFNALRNLANLRPVVAKQMERVAEQQNPKQSREK